MLRVFVGIKVSPPLKKVIANWSALHKNLPVRWIEDANLHLTLIPPWYVQSNEVEKIIKTLEPLKKGLPPISLHFNEISFGPDRKKPRLIWATGQSGSEISVLKKNLNMTLGTKEESRTFIPHLTIARFRTESFQTFPVKHLDEKILWKEKAENFTLFESVLRRSGAQYKILHEFKFRSST